MNIAPVEFLAGMNNPARSREGHLFDERFDESRRPLKSSPLHVALEEACSHARMGEVRRAIDLALESLDAALYADDWAAVASVLRRFDFYNTHPDLAVTVLMACKPARDRLPERKLAILRFAAGVRAQYPDRADALLRFL